MSFPKCIIPKIKREREKEWWRQRKKEYHMVFEKHVQIIFVKNSLKILKSRWLNMSHWILSSSDDKRKMSSNSEHRFVQETCFCYILILWNVNYKKIFLSPSFCFYFFHLYFSAYFLSNILLLKWLLCPPSQSGGVFVWGGTISSFCSYNLKHSDHPWKCLANASSKNIWMNVCLN